MAVSRRFIAEAKKTVCGEISSSLGSATNRGASSPSLTLSSSSSSPLVRDSERSVHEDEGVYCAFATGSEEECASQSHAATRQSLGEGSYSPSPLSSLSSSSAFLCVSLCFVRDPC